MVAMTTDLTRHKMVMDVMTETNFFAKSAKFTAPRPKKLTRPKSNVRQKISLLLS